MSDGIGRTSTSRRDASLSPASTGLDEQRDTSRGARATSLCGWCRGAIAATARRDAVYCSKRCRQAAHRFGRGCVARDVGGESLRLAYADPPYPGKAYLYREHVAFAGEVDHAELLSRLQAYDGWALSTSSEALPRVLALCVAEGLDDVRVAAWFRGAQMRARSHSPLRSWEPVLYRRARPRDASVAPVLDSLQYVARARLTDPERVIGAKPAAFIWWLFDLVAALPGDALDDLYPGSGGVSRAWTLYSSRRDPETLYSSRRDPETRSVDGRDMSQVDQASRLDREAA